MLTSANSNSPSYSASFVAKPELTGGVSIDQLNANTALCQDIADQISRLEKLISPVLATPEPVSAATPPAPVAECDLHDRLIADGERLRSLRGRLFSICDRVRL